MSGFEWLGAALAVGLLVSGQRERGARRFAQLDEDAVPRDMTWLTTLTLLSWCATLLADAPRAQRLYAHLLPYRERSVQDVLAANWGSVERYLGSLAMTQGDYPLAIEHFERALERNTTNPQALRLTRMEFAQALFACGDIARAHELLTEALHDAEAAGLAVVADFIRIQLSPRAPSDPPPHPEWS
jgi:tetratricopeptide (TPR) repeat protein